jgi:heme exporter protein C
MKNNVLLVIALGLSAGASYAAYITAPPDAAAGDMYRILYIHVPSAWVCYLAFTISLVTSILFLVQRTQVYDTTAELSAVFGLVYGAVALLTGAVWAHAAWGSYWNWDPRETTTLILWIAYLGYISLKRSIGDIERSNVIGAVYNILAFLTVPLSYLSIILIPTLHPQIVSVSGFSLSLPMLAALLLSLVAATLLFVYLVRVASAVRSLERRVDALLLFRKEQGEGKEHA